MEAELAPPQSVRRAPALVWISVVAGGAVALGLFLMLAGSARPEAPTFGLLLVGVALVVCLRGMHRIVTALASDNVEIIVESEAELGGASQREMREERRRLLRAINELRFDHEMGKLSKTDYDAVRLGYEVRAIEVMRALDGGRTLHPELAARLGIATDAVGGGDLVAVTDAESAPEADPDPALFPIHDAPSAVVPADQPSARECAACEGSNDPDSRFCKHCGKELAA